MSLLESTVNSVSLSPLQGTTAIKHNSTRIHTTYPGASYILPSDAGERERLELQHTLYKDAFGGKLVLAPVIFEAGDRVLDCRSGTGVWLLQLADEVSTDVHLQGMDIESRLFPRHIPYPNINFRVESTLSPPQEWKNTYKFIHQRLFIMALKKDQWAPELQQLYDMMLPGGYIQMCEPGSLYGGEATKKVRKMVSTLYESLGFDEKIWQRIPQLLLETGFVNVVVEERKVSVGKWAGKHGEGVRNNYFSYFVAIKSRVLDAGGCGMVNSEEELDSLLREFGSELDDTPGAYVRWFVFYAQKPSSAS